MYIYIYIYIYISALLVHEQQAPQNYKSDAFHVTIQLLVFTTREIYVRTQVVRAKRLNVEDDILTAVNFQQRCCLHLGT